MTNNFGFNFHRPEQTPEQARTMGGEYEVQLAEARNIERHKLFESVSILGALLLLYNFFNKLYVNIFYLACYTYLHGGVTLSTTVAKNYLRTEQLALVQTSAFSMTLTLFAIAMSAISLIIIAEAVFKVHLGGYLKPKKGCIKGGVYLFPMCVTLNIIVTNIISMVVTALDKSGVTVPDADFTITSPSAYSVVIQLIYVCLIGPIIEELIYRGLVLKLISPYGKGLAVFCSALFFALMHGNVPQAASAFAGGFIYAMVAVRYNSIVPTIIIHILNNICASIVDVGDVFGWTRAYEVYLASQILILFIGIYLTFTALRPLIWQIKSAEPPCALTLKQRYTAVFSNIFIICYLLYLIWGFIASFIVYNF